MHAKTRSAAVLGCLLAAATGAWGCDSNRDAEARALDQARSAAKELGGTLKKRLLLAMAEGGPPAAVRVCADEAQSLTAKVTERTGVRVGRSSLRLRNPANAPPGWVRSWLEAQGEGSAAEAEGVARVDATAGGPMARVIVPIAVEAPCVTCHGPRETLSPEVREVLDARYPHDRAVGYAPGDLRGALWAEAPVGRKGASRAP